MKKELKITESQLPKLTNEQRDKLIPILLKMLKAKSSYDRPITSDIIIKWFNENKQKTGMEKTICSPTLRKAINYIRTSGIAPVMSNSNGYFMCDDPKEIYKIAISLEQRAESINTAAKGLRELAKEIEATGKKKDDLWDML
jgi:hypothetical protein